jgi:hypothetical protein
MGLDTNKMLKKLGDDLVEEMIKEISAKGKIASKQLINSFRVPEVTENTLRIYNEAFSKGYQGQTEYYSGNVDLGRRPGKRPPISNIMRWLKAKGISGRDAKTGKFIKRRDAAFAISRKIGDYGYQGINYVQNTTLKFRPYIEQKLGLSYTEEIINMLKTEISKTQNI